MLKQRSPTSMTSLRKGVQRDSWYVLSVRSFLSGEVLPELAPYRTCQKIQRHPNGQEQQCCGYGKNTGSGTHPSYNGAAQVLHVGDDVAVPLNVGMLNELCKVFFCNA